ncbi:iron-containing alcohol dehydrogenase [Jiella sonneratiae]|uniref:Iron-containing alcohol dehydrogenase n=1 Tax=Jiella sonneratiae TaxID=2816856 RepID=A0ABS3J8S1_9HYPH|nr:iron-containing alcohol dehydrogenase [Jiella sonneratiae]MBO0906069.1 iron-containing alcohol dehydrogenase [Jiella sonneratiae]
MTTIDRPLEMLRPAMLRFGAGQVSTLADWLRDEGCRRAFVVSDAFNAARIDVLALTEPGIFGTVKPEPDVPNLEAAVAAARAFGPDVVIGFGGGSAMDLAKLVAVLLGSDRRIEDIVGPGRAPRRNLRLVQVPTTAGTGSEVGTRALVTDPSSRNKLAVESRHMLADLAIVDPGLTISVPPAVTAATGVDAMAHCVEAFTSRRSHPIVDAYALQGIDLVGRYLARAVQDGSDIEARAGLSLASFYGGVCLGPVNTTAGHAISYPLGTRHDIAHGVANALIFPHALAANASSVPDKTAAIGRSLGFDARDEAATLEGAFAFCQGLGLDMRLAAHGVPRDDLAAMAAEAHKIRRLLDHNPKQLAEADILRIYEAAF